MDFKQTLNLPKTDFPMKANLTKKEPEMIKKWEEENLYYKIIEKRKNSEKWILHDGPPYANGHIHMGHALNKILKDIIVKFRTMQGYNTYYIPGWDCHGLPIEHEVDKKLGKERFKKDIIEKRKMCREYAEKFVEIQKNEFKRLGVFGDWENPYLTMSYEYEAIIARELGKFFEKGSVYKSKKPVYWCSSCVTALAEAEVEYQEDPSPSIYVKFKVLGNLNDKFPQLSSNKEIYIIIWTTTPWTLPANVAIAVHPDFDYSFLECEDGIYILAKELSETSMHYFGIKNFKEIMVTKGKNLENIKCKHPFIERDSIIINADFVTLDAGTGCVHIAPGHGEEDYIVGLKYNLPVLNPVDDYGKFTKDVGVDKLVGLDVFKANEVVNDILEEKDALIKKDEFTHSYPHCWRCKNPIIFRATNQWFISMEKNNLREKALNSIKNEVKWIPFWGQERIYNMIENRPDWCISRQRAWGVPITVLYCKNCGKIIATKELFEKVFEIFKKEGADAWFIRDAKDFLPEGFKCVCGSDEFEKETDILDVWFDSGSSWAAVCENNPKQKYPANMYLEGSDQHRGWFHSSLLISIANRGIAPYKEVLTHGFVVDGEGKKMSKSAGNVIAPDEIVNKYGAEILRLWVTAQDYRDDIRISQEIIKRIVESYRRIRNTIRYMLGVLYDFDFEKDKISYNEMTEIDKYILAKLNRLIKRVLKAYNDYEFHIVYHKIYNFCIVDLSAGYLDPLKDRLYCESKNSKIRRSSQTAIYYILDALLKLIAPVLVFTSDEAWSYFKKNSESIHQELFPEIHEEFDNEKIVENWEKIEELKELVTKEIENARKEKIIGHSLDAKVEIFFKNQKEYNFFKEYEDDLKMFLITSQIKIELDENLDENVKISVKKADGEKCKRCWRFDLSVEKNLNKICSRCEKVLNS